LKRTADSPRGDSPGAKFLPDIFPGKILTSRL
jgi:hypothetical protein